MTKKPRDSWFYYFKINGPSASNNTGCFVCVPPFKLSNKKCCGLKARSAAIETKTQGLSSIKVTLCFTPTSPQQRYECWITRQDTPLPTANEHLIISNAYLIDQKLCQALMGLISAVKSETIFLLFSLTGRAVRDVQEI